MRGSTVALLCCLDDFVRLVEELERHHLPPPIASAGGGKLSPGEMLFTMVLFHVSAYKDFKDFWTYGLTQEYRHCFEDLPIYSRFVSLMPRLRLHYFRS